MLQLNKENEQISNTCYAISFSTSNQASLA